MSSAEPFLCRLLQAGDTLIQTLLSTEDPDVSLHGLLHSVTDIESGVGAVGSTSEVDILDGLSTSIEVA